MEFKRFFCALAAFLLVGTNIVSATPAFAADGDAEGDESMSEGAETDANINNLTEEEEPVEEDEEGEESDEVESEAEADEDEEEEELAAPVVMLGANRNAATIVTTSDELINALEAGGSVQLGANVDVVAGDWAYIAGETTLDLNGNTITFSDSYSDLYVSGGKLTITGEGKITKTTSGDALWAIDGGEIILESGDIEGVDYAVYAGSTWDTAGGKFTMNGGSISVDGWGIVGYANGEVEFNDGVINAGSGIGISGNGSTNCAGAKLTVNGGEINAALGVYAPQIDGVTTINGGVINATESGVEVRAGDLNITGGEINVPSDVAYTTAANGSGSTTTGAAIAVAQHTTKQAINVTVSGGVFTAPVPFSETNPQGNPESDIENITVSITGGTFNTVSGDTVISEDFSEFISGGIFNEAPEEEQIESGKDAYETTVDNASAWVVDDTADVNLPNAPILIQQGESFDFSTYLDAIAKKYGELSTDHPEFFTIADWMISGNAVGAAMGKIYVPVDGGMVNYPTLEQKRDIIQNTVDAMRSLGWDCPKVGVLACKEKVDPKMPETLDAEELKKMNERGEITGCIVDGPISFDCACDKEIADFKGYQSPVAGECDILLAPNIHAGNIMGKMMSVLCNSRLGGFLVGTTHPVIFSSRGSSSDEKFVSICLAAISSMNMK